MLAASEYRPDRTRPANSTIDRLARSSGICANKLSARGFRLRAIQTSLGPMRYDVRRRLKSAAALSDCWIGSQNLVSQRKAFVGLSESIASIEFASSPTAASSLERPAAMSSSTSRKRITARLLRTEGRSCRSRLSLSLSRSTLNCAGLYCSPVKTRWTSASRALSRLKVGNVKIDQAIAPAPQSIAHARINPSPCLPIELIQNSRNGRNTVRYSVRNRLRSAP